MSPRATGDRPIRRGSPATGRIKRLVRGNKWGIIRADDGRDVFLHKADVMNVAYNDLDEGAAVDFELIEDRLSGPRAQNVRLRVCQRS